MRTISYPETLDVWLYSESLSHPLKGNKEVIWKYFIINLLDIDGKPKTTGEQATEYGKAVKQWTHSIRC